MTGSARPSCSAAIRRTISPQSMLSDPTRKALCPNSSDSKPINSPGWGLPEIERGRNRSEVQRIADGALLQL
jgi:hypothetical protein